MLIRVALTLLLCSGQILKADLLYGVQLMGTLPGSIGASGVAINDSGQVVGNTYTVSCCEGPIPFDSFLYSNGQMIDLTSLGVPGAVFGINDAGAIAGGYYRSETPASFLFSNGQLTNLPLSSSWAYGINNAGQVVGTYDSGSSGASHVFIYSNGQITDLGMAGGSRAAINDEGQVVSGSYLYTNGQIVNLGTLTGYRSTVASGINNLGQVTGWACPGGVLATCEDSVDLLHIMRAGEAFLYSNGHMIDLGTLGGSFSVGMAVNDAGQVVGWSTTSTGAMHAFLYSDGKMMDLNDLIAPGTAPSYALGEADAINNEGQIVAGGYLLTPMATSVPEPGTLILFSLALTGLVIRSGRKCSSTNADPPRPGPARATHERMRSAYVVSFPSRSGSCHKRQQSTACWLLRRAIVAKGDTGDPA
jgi:chitinase